MADLERIEIKLKELHKSFKADARYSRGCTLKNKIKSLLEAKTKLEDIKNCSALIEHVDLIIGTEFMFAASKVLQIIVNEIENVWKELEEL